MTDLPEPTGDTALLRQLVLAWSPFALGLAAVIFVSIVSANVAHARAQYSVWLALLLASPALWMFARDVYRRPLSQLWRLYWTLGFAAYVFHLWYAFGVLFGGDFDAVIASQGASVALGNAVVTLLWAADVVCAWGNLQGRFALVLRVAAHLGVLVAGVVSTLVFFRNETAAAVGFVMLAAFAWGVFQRLRTPAPA